MKTFIVYILLAFLLIGCQHTKAIGNNSYDDDNSEVNKSPQVVVKDTNHVLKEGMDNLLNEDNYSLKVRLIEGDFYQASDYFTSRIIELLSRDLEPVWKDNTINEHQVELKFEGYQTIFINTELETYWFEDSSEIFSAKGIEELWNRYIVKIINHQPIFHDFEKAILSRIDYYYDEHNVKRDALLFYDGDIRLRVGEDEIILQKHSNIMENYGNNIRYNSDNLKINASLEYIDSLRLLMYIYLDGSHTYIKFYRYLDNQIVEVFSSDDINIEVDISRIKTGIVDMIFPFSGIIKELKLTNKEIEFYKKTIQDFREREINIDEDKLELIKDNIVFIEREVMFLDVDDDDVLELILIGELKTYGALTPIHFSDNIVFVFSLCSDGLECIDVILERDDHIPGVIELYLMGYSDY